jgi:ABC-type multidrug transport system fused ATPase/permease subunit
MSSDKILVLSYGKVKEYDSPSNLMANPESEFSKLVDEIKKKE